MILDIDARKEGAATEITITAVHEAAACCGPSCCSGEADVQEETPVQAADARTGEEIKALVREKYAAVATAEGEGCGCGSACCGDELAMVGEGYDALAGYVADADLGLGCGLPTEQAGLAEGQVVLDLGSGAGIDAFIARSIVGGTGEVLGVDMTPEMVEKARANATKLGYENVSFYEGDIEALPLPDGRVDVVVSNCVLNLVPDKPAAFAEMHRVLRPGGHFCVSDIVVRGALPQAVRASAELYVGCVAGAIEEQEYLGLLREAGFSEVRVVKAREIELPDGVFEGLLSETEVETLRRSGAAVVSVTVYGERH